MLLEYRFYCTGSCITGEGFSNKNEKSVKVNAVFSFNADLSSGVGKLSKRLLFAFKIIIDRTEPQLLFLNVLS